MIKLTGCIREKNYYVYNDQKILPVSVVEDLTGSACYEIDLCFARRGYLGNIHVTRKDLKSGYRWNFTGKLARKKSFKCGSVLKSVFLCLFEEFEDCLYANIWVE